MRNMEEKWKFAILLAGGAGFHAHLLFYSFFSLFFSAPKNIISTTKQESESKHVVGSLFSVFALMCLSFFFFFFFLFLGLSTMVSSQNDPKTNHRNSTSQRRRRKKAPPTSRKGRVQKTAPLKNTRGGSSRTLKKERGGEWRRSPISANLNRSGPCFM